VGEFEIQDRGVRRASCVQNPQKRPEVGKCGKGKTENDRKNQEKKVVTTSRNNTYPY